MSRARSRDRRVYLRSHPILFALLAATRHRPALRVGRTVLVHDREAYLTALTGVRLDRTASGTTGGAAGRLAGPGALFDQQGRSHRETRRAVADLLGPAAVRQVRPVWRRLLADRLATGETDLVPLVAELAGATTAALLGLGTDPVVLAAAAREAAAAAARAHLLGVARRHAARRADEAADRLLALVGHAPGARGNAGLAAVLAVAAINTTVAALPRAAAWACDDGLWDFAASHPEALADELLRVTAPTPLLPRAPAEDAFLRPARAGMAGRCPVRPGDRMLLVARHAVDAHRRDPDPRRPAPAHQARLVFGAGPHVCPGARLARAQTVDFLAALAPLRPVVVRARADRRSALPGWASLVVRATR